MEPSLGYQLRNVYSLTSGNGTDVGRIGIHNFSICTDTYIVTDVKYKTIKILTKRIMKKLLIFSYMPRLEESRKTKAKRWIDSVKVY